MSTTQKISARIIMLVQSGLTVREAVDMVLGAGTSAKLVDDLYEQLRKG